MGSGAAERAGRQARPRIAVFSGPTATIQNSEPLVTSNKARAKYGLPERTDPDGMPLRFDVVRPQRLARPVTVYVEQFSAHPLERDSADLYAPPDGYVDAAGVFHTERTGPADVAVYEMVLLPQDGLYSLPYFGRQADGSAWESDCASPNAPADRCRQPFYPDASRIFEEIDRFGVGRSGLGALLSSKAEYDHYRAAPPGGFVRGLPAAERTDIGAGDIPPEVIGEDFYPYRPSHLRHRPTLRSLARLTNTVQGALATGRYAGAIWLESSITVEETLYWLNLLIDTSVPIVGNASQRAHGGLSNDGDRNIVDAVRYITSRIWAGPDGADVLGGVVIQDELIFSAREVQKADARPGGYRATGGHGGIVGTVGDPDPPRLTFLPVRRHTSTSLVNLHRLPGSVLGVRRRAGTLERVQVRVVNEGRLLPQSLPRVTIVKTGHYHAPDPDHGPADEIALNAQVDHALDQTPLAGLVAEGGTPHGSAARSVDAMLELAVHHGIPVVKVGRGNADGFCEPQGWFIGGQNLTATKARLLLMACLLRFGSLPPASDPTRPSRSEDDAIRKALADYQQVFDTH